MFYPLLMRVFPFVLGCAVIVGFTFLFISACFVFEIRIDAAVSAKDLPGSFALGCVHYLLLLYYICNSSVLQIVDEISVSVISSDILQVIDNTDMHRLS